MSGGWSLYVIVLIVVNILGCGWLLFANRSVQIDPREKGRSTGHDFDGIEELNNPLPAWWTWLFIGTILFSVGYFVLYPGFGSFAGTLGWSSAGQHAGEHQGRPGGLRQPDDMGVRSSPPAHAPTDASAVTSRSYKLPASAPANRSPTCCVARSSVCSSPSC